MELGKEHILALQSDGPLLEQAIRSLRKKNRPRLRPSVHGDDDDQEDEDEAVIEVEMSGLRTDSNVGFPIYQA